MEIPNSSDFATVHSSVTSQPNRNTGKQLLASCMIGNALEWYDFVIYGYFAVSFGALFFPGADPVLQLLASWGVFWTGFLARPLGSIVFGYIGDKVSRKSALSLSIYFMAIPTALMGCLPTYAQVGLIAPVFLIILRSLQGLAIGGEFTGSMVFLIEHAEDSKRGLWGSFASFSAVLGVISGSLLVAGLNSVLSSEDMLSWGWRIPFILSVLGSLVAAYMRRQLVDPEIYLEVKENAQEESMPLRQLFQHYKSKIGVIILLDFLTAIGFFIVAIFLATYFKTYLKVPNEIALTINTVSMCVFAVSTLLGGLLSDRFGRKAVLGIACLGFMAFSYPLFSQLQSSDYYGMACVQSLFAFMMGLFFGVIPTTLAEIMPTKIRCSGLSIGHNLSMAIFGGGAPFMASHLIQNTGNIASPAYLLVAAAFLSLCSLFFIKDQHQMSLL